MRLDNESKVKLGISALITVVCSVSMVVTKGETGIGWFLIAMILMWSN